MVFFAYPSVYSPVDSSSVYSQSGMLFTMLVEFPQICVCLSLRQQLGASPLCGIIPLTCVYPHISMMLHSSCWILCVTEEVRKTLFLRTKSAAHYIVLMSNSRVNWDTDTKLL